MLDREHELSQRISELKKEQLQLTMEHWYKYELFTWQWWIKFIYLFIPIYIFYKLLDRKRIFEIMTYGILISLFSTAIDVICIHYHLYSYSIRSIPTGFFSIHDLFFIPIVSMLFYQYNSNWKRFIIANLALAALGSFVKEPIFVWIKVLKLNNWSSIYSFLLFFITAVSCKCIVDKIKKIHEKNTA